MITGGSDYPPTLTSQIADRIRANPDKPAPEAFQSPNGKRASATQFSVGEQGTKNCVDTAGSGYPRAAATQPPLPLGVHNDTQVPAKTHVGNDAPVMLPTAGRREEEAPTLPTMLPIRRRSSNISAQDAPMLPIRRRSSDISNVPTAVDEGPPMLPFACIGGSEPLLPSACMGGDAPNGALFLPLGFDADECSDGLFLPYDSRSSVPLHERQRYVTDTVTTPLSSGIMQSTRRPQPVPISSLGPSGFGSCLGSGIQNVSIQSAPLPRWARSYSYSSPSGESPNSRNSLGASLTDASFVPIHKSSSDSHGSIRWTPDAFVQCWHRKLSETYQDYNMVNIVGEGRAGAVFIVQHLRTEKFVACKALNKKDQDMDAIKSEIKTLRHLDHPNIVRLYEVNEDQEFVFLLMELCLGGDLFVRISDAGQLSENHSRIFAQQMLSALAYCHSHGIVHRDVKPENFLLETDDPDCLRLKLADFGIATSIRPNNIDTGSILGSRNYGFNNALPSFIENNQQSGSLPYMAPEIISGNWHAILKDVRASVQIFAASDLWGIGAVVYVMLCGCLPFGTDPVMICSGLPPDFSTEVWSHVSEEAVNLILALLNPNLKERWTAKQALTHKWFNGISTNEITQNHKLGATKPEDGVAVSRNELASRLLRSLRQWRKMRKLRRFAVAAMAKKLEASHESHQVARAAFNTFNNGKSTLKCDDLVKAMNLAVFEMTTTDINKETFARCPSPTTPEEVNKHHVHDEKTLTGLHVRQRLRNTFKRLARVNEDTPKSGSFSSLQLVPEDTGDLVSLTELRLLVSSLDGMKNGVVDYTLLVAALITPEVYHDDVRIGEVFDLFDFQKKGKISPDDVRKILNAKSTELKEFKEMVREFDLDSDGMLDMAEFQAMVRGDCRPPSTSFYSAQSPKAA